MIEKVKPAIKSFFLTYDQKTRERGDDTGIFLYGAFYIYIGSMLLFTRDASLLSQLLFYSHLDLMVALFIGLHLWRSPNKSLDITRPKEIASFIPWVIASMLVLLLMGHLIENTIGAATSTENTLFHYFRLIETEELVYRGLAIEVFLLLDRSRGLVRLDVNRPTLQLLADNKFFLIGSIASSFLFGIAHNSAYGGDPAPLIYLTIMGFLAAFLRYKFGLVAPILLHVMNNFIAMNGPGNAWIFLVILEFIAAFLDFAVHYKKGGSAS